MTLTGRGDLAATAGRVHEALEQVGLPWHSVESDGDQVRLVMPRSQAEGLAVVLGVAAGLLGVKGPVFAAFSQRGRETP